MEYILLLFSCIFSIELFQKLKLSKILKLLIHTTNKVLKVLSSNKISDHWKEKVIPIYAIIIFKKSTLILALLLFIVLIFSLSIIFNDSFYDLLFSVQGIFLSIFLSILYLLFKSFFNE